MPPLMECVPNFSEGRSAEVIEALLNAIRIVNGVKLLHHTSDADHHRTVITFVGEPDAVMKAAFEAIKIAAERIDMEQHRGLHPRLGAADVVPFVPLRELILAECADYARQLGKRVGDELGLPVYLYEAAASHPDRRNLAHVRRGEYEGLKRSISQPERTPDFGPAQVGKAGAVIIGARQALIAYNVFLTTDDVSIARHIAKAIRQSSGGLTGVKALGFLVRGRAQIAMSLTDYHQTPLHRVMEAIRAEAAQFGAAIAQSELIGMIPEDALIETARWYLQLDDFTPAQILERQLDFD